MLKHRLRSGVIMGLALLAAIFFLNAWQVLVVMLAVCGLALLEFYALLDAKGVPHFKLVGLFSGLALVAGTSLASITQWALVTDAESLLLFGAVVAILIRQITVTNGDRPWDTMAGTLLGVMYVAFLINFFVKLLTLADGQAGRLLLLYMVAVVKFTDIGAYFVGCAIGRHKLIPRISPAKSWEGVIGGVITGVGASFGYRELVHHQIGSYHFHAQDALVIGILLAVAGVIGDLVESLLKRAAGVKDSGTLIMGMGGILDVLDSLLFAAPVLYLYVRLLL